jgi:EpsI family protein
MYTRMSNKWACIAAILLLFSSGAAYRLVSSHLNSITNKTIRLPVALKNIPNQIGRWHGTEVTIPENIQQIARNDDYLSRRYVNNLNEWANVYIAYSARPRTMLGHRPEICYVGSGWVHDSTDRTTITCSDGRSVTCLLHRFHMPAPRYSEQTVLNFYIVNGYITIDEGDFSGLGWRTPNIKGDPARYVGQIQTSSALESSVFSAAGEIIPHLLTAFPDSNTLQTKAN